MEHTKITGNRQRQQLTHLDYAAMARATDELARLSSGLRQALIKALGAQYRAISQRLRGQA